MKNLPMAVLACLALAWSNPAFAATDYEAHVMLDGALPPLRTGVPFYDGPHNIDGDWTDLGRRDARAYVRDVLGRDSAGAPLYEAWRGGPGRHNVSGPYNTIGEVIAWSPSLSGSGSAEATVWGRSISAKGRSEALDADLSTSAVWTRGFSIAAGESFTFKTLCTLSILGDDSPLDSLTWFSLDASSSFASLSMADTANRVRASLFASLNSAFTGSLADVFSYRIGPGGALSLSVTNTTGGWMTGSLGAGSHVEVSAPIPEPGTWALMLVGAGMVAGAARRHQRPAP